MTPTTIQSTPAQPAQPPAPAQHTLHVISHTHWDREWYLPFQRFRMRLVRTVDELLDIFESDDSGERGERSGSADSAPFSAFHLDGQAVVLEDYLEIRPENRERLARQIRAGRILVGPWYVLPDEFLISGESHIRNLLVGQQEVARLSAAGAGAGGPRRSADTPSARLSAAGAGAGGPGRSADTPSGFGPSMHLGYLPDLFGHISQMPQLLVDAGFDTAVLWRGLSGEREGLKSELFWESPDGSRVLCVHLPEQSGYSNANNLPMDAEVALERVRSLREERGRHATTEHLLLMNGTDHHGPQRALPRLIRALNARLSAEGAHLVHTTLPAYVHALRATLDLDGHSSSERSRPPSHIGGRPPTPVTPSFTGAPRAERPWHDVDPDTSLQIRRGELRDVNRSGTLYSNFLLYGVASARVYLKQANHRAQQALERYAEPWSSIAWLLGAPYPHGLLRQSWKYLLQNHPHDSICGCSVDEVHEQMMTRFQWSHEIAAGVTDEALHQLTLRAARPDLPEGDVAVRLFNPLPWARDEVVEATAYLPPDSTARAFVVRDGAGNVLPAVVRGDRVSVRTVEHSDMRPAPRHVRSREVTLAFRAPLPATGYSTFAVHPLQLPAVDRPTPAATDVAAEPSLLENEHLRVEVGPGGSLLLLDKATGHDFRRLLVFEDGGDVGDEYTYAPPERDRVITSDAVHATSSLLEAGPTVGRLQVDLTLDVPAEAANDRRSRSERTTPLYISTVITLAAGSRRVECETTVHNTAKDHRVRVLFRHIASAKSHYVDQAFDVVERPNTYPSTPAEFWNEDAPDTHPQRLFVDLTDGESGLALLNQGLAEYGIVGGPDRPRGVALTLLRCVQFLGAAAYPSTIRSGAGPHLETPGAQCLGTHTFKYALVPHAGDWQAAGLVREAIDYCTPPTSYAVDDNPLPWVPPWASVNQRRNAAALAAQLQAELPQPTLGPTESFLSIEGDAVISSALKRAETTGSLVLRLYNPTTQPQSARIRLRQPIARAHRASVLEEPFASAGTASTEDGAPLLVDGGALSLTLAPKKIVTLVLESATGSRP